MFKLNLKVYKWDNDEGIRRQEVMEAGRPSLALKLTFYTLLLIAFGSIFHFGLFCLGIVILPVKYEV